MASSTGLRPYPVSNIPVNVPTTTNLRDVKDGPMSNAGQALIGLYTDYRNFRNSGGRDANFHSSQSDLLLIEGSSVGVTVRGRSDLTTLTNQIRSLDGQIIYRSGQYVAATVLVPIAQLHSLATMTGIASVTPLYRPVTNAQGSAANQADAALNSDKVRSTYGLDGTGIKIGVLSDSVDQVEPGIPGSIATGDLPSSGVQVIADDDPTGADEGRGMIELMHDIAPNATFAFAAAGSSDLVFADRIRALADAGCQVIVDDIRWTDEPFFQPGVIDQAISDFVADSGVYLTSAGNFSDAGFEAPTNFTKIGRDRYVDFDSGPGVDTRMRIEVGTGGTFTFGWDNPWNGFVGNASTDLDVYLYSVDKPNRIIAAATGNNIKTGQPLEILGGVPEGRYDMVIRVADTLQGKPLPTRFKFVFTSDFTTLTTEYPGIRSTTQGHSNYVDSISVGAVSAFDAPPLGNTAPTSVIPNEGFSSAGPATQIFDANGNRLDTPVTLNKPDISSIDDVNTSFFGQLNEQRGNALPYFTGTSAAAPDAAAVAALIKQMAPTATSAQILDAFKSTATPVNGAPIGTYDPKGGYGLVNALEAVKQFAANPTVSIPAIDSPRITGVDNVKIVFSQQVSGFDVSDLVLQNDGGPNLLTGGNTIRTTDGGRTYLLSNLADITGDVGTYTLRIDDVGTPIVNAAGVALEAGAARTLFEVTPPPARPKAPSALVAKVISDTQVRLRFSDNSTTETSFTIQRAEDPGFTNKVKNFTVAASTTTFTDSTLEPTGRTLYYRVRAVQGLTGTVSSYSNIVTVTTLSAGEIILDNESSSGVKVTGSWSTADDTPGFLGGSYLEDNDSGKGAKSVRYSPNLETAGDYFVYMRWTRATDRATNVPVDIIDADGDKTTVIVNERDRGGNGYVLLGKFNFKQGAFGSVTVRNAGTNGTVVADAMRFLPAAPGTPVNPTD